MSFQDHFSTQAQDYAQYRPHYPETLFDYLSNLCKEHELAWDCATGNGQAAVKLAEKFKKVIATDLSTAQITVAEKLPNIEYRVEPAEQATLIEHSVDLITVATAYHWFDISAFAHEVHRILKPDGVLAVWCYGLCHIDPKLDDLFQHFYYDTVGEFWPAGRKYIDERYETIAFPFPRLQTPKFYMETHWNLAQFLGYLSTWSAVQYYKKAKGHDPVIEVTAAFIEFWGDPEEIKKISWDIYLLVSKL